MKAIKIENPGNDYRLVLADIPKPSPAAGEILIKITAAGLNHADLAQSAGRYPPPPGAPDTLGMECSGEVAEIGAGVTNFKVGDKVCALLGGGGYAEYVAVSAKSVLPVPKGVSVIDAAALPEVHFTVWTNLMNTAWLKPGESVLIHGGTSGIGTAAIQLCVARGHKVLSTAATAEKCAAIQKLGGHAINYKGQDFVEIAKAATNGKGVDVILDMVGGDYIQRNMSAAALWGRIVNIAYMSGLETKVNFGPMLMKRLSLLATTLRARSADEKGAIRDAVQREVWPLIEAGKIKPIVAKTFSLAEAQAAHALMKSSSHIGKILLTV
jgi:putative PIG3 family NAD(P)H quinone oxidoreductase